jgi:type IV secretory pathway TraG/TraD family ATPase VirD4
MPLRSDEISYFGTTNFHGDRRPFGITQSDRLSHLYVVGRTGVGKSTLLAELAIADVRAGRGVALVDPHGDLVRRVLAGVPDEERHRVVYLDATDPAQPYGYNPLRQVRLDKIPLAASGLLETMRKLWPDAWGVRMEHVLRNCLYALLEREGSTLPDILRLLSDDVFRRVAVAGIRNAIVRSYWMNEFANYHPRQQSEASAPIQNKLGAMLADPRLYRILVAPPQDLSFRRLMDEGAVLLVNLSKGEIGEDGALVLGSLIVSTIGLAAFSRAEVSEADRRPFFLYADEFHTFTTLSLASMLSELRKYGLGMTFAHQYLHQLEPEILQAILGNAGTLICFRVGAQDAPLLSREFEPTFGVEDLVNLPNFRFYTKLLIDGAPSRPFSASLVRDAGESPRLHPPGEGDAWQFH